MMEAEPARGSLTEWPSLADVLLSPGALRTVFQPIVRCREGGWSLHALECLPRGPSGSPYAEAGVLDAAARACHIEAKVDRARVTSALETAAHCGIKSLLFVKISAVTLMTDGGFSDFLATTAAGNGVDWRRVTIEVHEPERECDEQALAPALRSLHRLGVRLAVSAFGLTPRTARSRESDPEHPALVKFDGRLLHQAGHCAGTRQRLVADLASARARGVEVIAEGVEAEAEFQLAAHLGIELVQGHHVCRPLSGEFSARIESMFGRGR